MGVCPAWRGARRLGQERRRRLAEKASAGPRRRSDRFRRDPVARVRRRPRRAPPLPAKPVLARPGGLQGNPRGTILRRGPLDRPVPLARPHSAGPIRHRVDVRHGARCLLEPVPLTCRSWRPQQPAALRRSTALSMRRSAANPAPLLPLRPRLAQREPRRQGLGLHPALDDRHAAGPSRPFEGGGELPKLKKRAHSYNTNLSRRVPCAAQLRSLASTSTRL